jgi:mRNA interferase ChpB
MKRGDIYLVDLELTTGHEQRGQRPVVVASTERFNRLTSCPVILPITNGGQFARGLGFTVALSGTQTTGVVRCDQPRALDLLARGARKVESLPPVILAEVLTKTAALFS